MPQAVAGGVEHQQLIVPIADDAALVVAAVPDEPALADAAREGDLPAISETAHLIKGSALTFGAPRLVNLCAALQMSPGESRSLVPAVAQEFEELASVLSSYLGDVRP